MIIKKSLIFSILSVAAMLILASCGTSPATTDTQPTNTDKPIVEITDAPTTDSQAPSASEGTDVTDTPATTEAPSSDAPATNAPAETSEVIAPVGYDWSKPVPESAKKDASWFDDAVMIGDSRMGGFQIFAGVYNAEYITFAGMAVDKFFTWEFYPKNGETLTAAEALKTLPNNFSKVYINLGLNELGWDPYFGSFKNKLCEVIDAVRAWDSDVDIYLISVFPTSKARKATVVWETLENVEIINQKIMEAATEKQAYYVDMDTIFRDAEGYLPAGYSNDGVHLNSPYVRQFRDYLLTHTVEVN
jgi:hypothetical protein